MGALTPSVQNSAKYSPTLLPLFRIINRVSLTERRSEKTIVSFLPLLTYFSEPCWLEVYTLLKRLVLLLPTQVEGQSIDGITDSDHTKPLDKCEPC